MAFGTKRLDCNENYGNFLNIHWPKGINQWWRYRKEAMGVKGVTDNRSWWTMVPLAEPFLPWERVEQPICVSSDLIPFSSPCFDSMLTKLPLIIIWFLVSVCLLGGSMLILPKCMSLGPDSCFSLHWHMGFGNLVNHSPLLRAMPLLPPQPDPV